MKNIHLKSITDTTTSKAQLLEFLNQMKEDNNDFIKNDISLSQYVEKLMNHAIIYVLIKHTAIIGMVAFYANDTSKKTAFISSIGVRKQFTGQALGLKLLLKACKVSKEKMMTTIGLDVRKENAIAIAFYKKNGFNIINESKELYRMVKQL